MAGKILRNMKKQILFETIKASEGVDLVEMVTGGCGPGWLFCSSRSSIVLSRNVRSSAGT
ncbi:MAG: hypothetical protein HN580_13245 [Deltaproteobacteria bacterium]|jgi:hypothetical protein|nr:hypothetical protein [Deltaproteobacteria bacterium]MBT4262670.1 hypothetical protein [Deltaproteobacteria bacterium]MBT4643215.1 hypothetical protein [Deltaproteobacteria bacterium]MBT6503754.1 hypothetical protein [Deltaproteobacteria bacterium]MBT6611680.1 hypothetical protein [Deltaproteobacteria bacterium]